MTIIEASECLVAAGLATTAIVVWLPTYGARSRRARAMKAPPTDQDYAYGLWDELAAPDGHAGGDLEPRSTRAVFQLRIVGAETQSQEISSNH
jgi:hypothetical protein